MKAGRLQSPLAREEGERDWKARSVTVAREQAPANYVPAAAVTRKVRALFGIIGRKGHVGGMVSRA